LSYILQCFRDYIGELQRHLFDNQGMDSIMNEMENSHRKQRFIAMYLIQSKEIFYRYFEKRKELQLEGIFYHLIFTLLQNKETFRLKELFVEELALHSEMIPENFHPSPYKVKEIEKDLRAFSFYQTKRELKGDID